MRFAEVRVGFADDVGVVDGRVGEEVVLDLLGGDLLAAPVDLVLGAASTTRWPVSVSRTMSPVR
ncbi:hypothetical protein SMD44_08633 [Streptomyces alboflavus]|uniref:Uncharacterized protein n=1 Tax=Streptomyces alboflavus TaxID=67267 RepID=A0A1Z1WRT7_9ACTN|nr:hypothetical protein SMD44_08633 [Streptomyces alboflavus]